MADPESREQGGVNAQMGQKCANLAYFCLIFVDFGAKLTKRGLISQVVLLQMSVLTNLRAFGQENGGVN